VLLSLTLAHFPTAEPLHGTSGSAIVHLPDVGTLVVTPETDTDGSPFHLLGFYPGDSWETGEIAATFAEPAIGALQAAGEGVSAQRAALLKALLGPRVDELVLAVAAGVGVAVVVGLLRFLFSWRLKALILAIVPVCLALTAYAASQPGLDRVIGLAWDCGGITTGPVTVPLVLAVAHFGFGVPIRGELWELGLASLAFIMCNVSLGVLVSTYAQNQQQSMLGTFIILYPAQMLSGILYPLENMPKWLYWMTYLNPLRYFAVLIRNIMLKGGSPELFWPNIGGLVVLTAFLLTLASGIAIGIKRSQQRKTFSYKVQHGLDQVQDVLKTKLDQIRELAS
jgi:hypothetical protein